MSKSLASKALARSYGAERTLTTLIGLITLIGGVLALIVGLGWLGGFRAGRSVLDPMAVDWLGRHATPAKIVAIVLGVLLLIAGIWWLVRALRTEGKPDLELDRTGGRELTVTSGAIADAVAADAQSIDGVSKARARSVGSSDTPAMRLTLWLREGTNLKDVWDELDSRVLARARRSLDVEALPTAVRIELDSGERQRVR